jgi:hypothetical protein
LFAGDPLGANGRYDNPYWFCVEAGEPSANNWTTYTGWFKGTTGTPTSSPSTDPQAPKAVHTDVRYIAPCFILNGGGGNSSFELDEIAIDIGDDISEGAIVGNMVVEGTLTANLFSANYVEVGNAAADVNNGVTTIDGGKITTDTIIADHIQANSITTAKINNLAVTEAKLGNLAVTGAKIANLAIDTDKLANLAITVEKIGNNAVEYGKVAANAVDSPQLVAGSVIAGKLGAASVEAGNLAAASVQAGNLAALAVLAGNVAANAITATEIAAGTITAAELAANYVEVGGSAADVNAGVTTINGGKITTNTIVADHIQANSITTVKINNSAVTTTKVNNLAITETKLGNGAVTVNKLAANSVTADKILVGNLSTINKNLGEITAGILTGATVRTSSGNAARIVMNSTGLDAFDSGNNYAMRFNLASEYLSVQKIIGMHANGALADAQITMSGANTLSLSPSPAQCSIQLTTDANHNIYLGGANQSPFHADFYISPTELGKSMFLGVNNHAVTVISLNGTSVGIAKPVNVTGNLTASNVTANAALNGASANITGNANLGGNLYIANNQVVGPRQAGIYYAYDEPSALSAINSLIWTLQEHGMIANIN